MRQTAAARPVIAVAAGCLINAAGEVLIAQRPAGKIAAGLWEFPGGKIEAGESAYDGLCRELREEIGIEVESARPLLQITHAYTERTVRLDCWRVERWRGTPQSREQQALAWVRPERSHEYPLLAADGPIVSALCLPSHYVFTPPAAGAQALRDGLAGLPAGALLRLRLPALDDAAYAEVAAALLPAVRAAGLRLIVDRDPAQALALGADGWHARSAVLMGLRQRPALPLCLASCHDAAELAQAQRLGFDAAVLGAVLPTASHPGVAGLGWETATALLQQANLPVYLIGGLGPAELGAAHAAYAQGIAAIRAYW